MKWEPITAVVAVDAEPQWYAIRTVVQREYVVAELLRRHGMATFIPTEIRAIKRSSYAKGKAESAVPIMPGMVFVGFPSTPCWYEVLRNHLIVAPFSLGTEGMPTRLDFVRLLRFFSGVNDGCMVRDNGLRLIHVPGHPRIRALDTRVRTISARRRGEKAKKPMREGDDRPATVTPSRKYADFLSRFVHGGVA